MNKKITISRNPSAPKGKHGTRGSGQFYAYLSDEPSNAIYIHPSGLTSEFAYYWVSFQEAEETMRIMFPKAIISEGDK